MSQRGLTRQQVVGDADPLLDCAAVRGSRLKDSHRHSWHARAVLFSLAKGSLTAVGMRA
jgi:hypothetical protein